MKKKIMPLFIVLWTGFARLANSEPRTPEEIYRGEVTCIGPYTQPQLRLPENWIELHIQWDPIFQNSDVSFRVGRKVHGEATERLAFWKSGPTSFPPSNGYAGNVLWHDKEYEIRLNLLDRDHDGSSIETGSLSFEGDYYFLKCEESQ